jgi:hypothetical protein
MEYIAIIQNNAPYRWLRDGWYKEDVEVPGTDGQRFTAQVETYYRGSVLQHSIRVTVSSDDIVGVNKWFDALLRGEKNEFCANPAPLVEQPSVVYAEDIVAARRLLDSMFEKGFSGRDKGEILFDCEKLRNLLAGRSKTTPPAGSYLAAKDAPLPRGLIYRLRQDNLAGR